jgi:hypothetical protein
MVIGRITKQRVTPCLDSGQADEVNASKACLKAGDIAAMKK